MTNECFVCGQIIDQESIMEGINYSDGHKSCYDQWLLEEETHLEYLESEREKHYGTR